MRDARGTRGGTRGPLTAAQLLPEGCGRGAAVPALVSELAAALAEAEARSLPDGWHQLRLLPAQLLLPGAQRRAGAPRFLRTAGGGDAQPPAGSAPQTPRSATGPRGHAWPRSPLPSPATHVQVPPAAPGQRASSSAARSRHRPRGAPRPMAGASSQPLSAPLRPSPLLSAPGCRDRGDGGEWRPTTRLCPPRGATRPSEGAPAADGRAAGEARAELYSRQGEKVAFGGFFPPSRPAPARPPPAAHWPPGGAGAGRGGPGERGLRCAPQTPRKCSAPRSGRRMLPGAPRRLPGAPRRRCFFLRALKLLPGVPAGLQARQRKLGVCGDVTPESRGGTHS